MFDAGPRGAVRPGWHRILCLPWYHHGPTCMIVAVTASGQPRRSLITLPESGIHMHITCLGCCHVISARHGHDHRDGDSAVLVFKFGPQKLVTGAIVRYYTMSPSIWTVMIDIMKIS